MPKRLIAVLETGSLAGGVRVVGEICNRLADKGWKVEIYSVNPRETMAWFPLHKDIEWLSFYRTGTLADYEQLIAVLEKQAAFKMATFWRTAYPVAQASKAGEGVYLVQDVETSYASQPVIHPHILETYGLGLNMLTTSKWVLNTLPQMGFPQPNYIGIGLGGIYVPNSKKVSNGRPLAVLRRQALKGFSELMEVARYFHHDGIALKTFGMNPTREINAQVLVPVDHEGSDKGLLTDARIVELYQTHGVFICTSNHEGFNLTVLEAMACGLPVVTTDNHGNMEYCENGKNCLVRQDPADIYLAAREVLADRNLQRQFRNAGIETAQKYKWKDVITRTEQALGA